MTKHFIAFILKKVLLYLTLVKILLYLSPKFMMVK